MSEHRDARREVGKLSPAPVQAPRAGGISDKNTRDENRRLKEKNEHGMHLVISPRLLIAPIGAASRLQCRELTLSRLLAMGPQANRANPRCEIMRDSRPLKSRNTTGHRNSTDIPSPMAGASGIGGQLFHGREFVLRRGRTQTRRHPGSRPQGRWRPPAARAPMVRVRLAAPRSPFQRFDVLVASPW
jgi:hypothetical protein